MDIKWATEQVEKGHGCVLREEMDKAADNDARLAMIMEIAEENKRQRQAGAEVPIVLGKSYATGTWAGFSLERITGIVSSDLPYKEEFRPAFPKTTRKVDCNE